MAFVRTAYRSGLKVSGTGGRQETFMTGLADDIIPLTYLQRMFRGWRVPRRPGLGFGESYDRKPALQLFEITDKSNPRVPRGSQGLYLQTLK